MSTTSTNVKAILEDASNRLTQHYINHTDYLESDFWHIEVSTDGFNSHEVQKLENELNAMFENDDINVIFNGRCFKLGWYYRNNRKFERCVCLKCYGFIDKVEDLAPVANVIHVKCQGLKTIDWCITCGLDVLENQPHVTSQVNGNDAIRHKVCPFINEADVYHSALCNLSFHGKCIKRDKHCMKKFNQHLECACECHKSDIRNVD